MKAKHWLAALGVSWLPTTALLAQSIELGNPIPMGFYSDPSIVKVGPTYYLVNATFSYFPCLPAMHSRDLRNWRQVGSVISRPAQLDFLGDRMTRGLFAPAIAYHNGTYYVTCTLIDHQGNFVVTAKNPAGPWSNPTFLPDVRGIDPSLFFEDDKAYVVYNSDPPNNKPLYEGHRSIKMIELNPSTLATVGEAWIVVNGGVDLNKKPVRIGRPTPAEAGRLVLPLRGRGRHVGQPHRGDISQPGGPRAVCALRTQPHPLAARIA